MKLLSICIPTYNRPDKIKNLYQSFLNSALEKYGDKIEIVICDNSDHENSCLNQTNLGDLVCYHKNHINLGFEGNLIQCVKQANGEFIWIISDDDLILWDGFERLMDFLLCASRDDIDCLVLPINYRKIFGELIDCRQNKESIEREDTDLHTFVTSLPTVPFGYFSAAVIRVNKEKLDWVSKEFHDNIIINIPLYLKMLKPTSRLRFLDSPIIEYQEASYVRMDIVRFFTGARDVIHFLEKEYSVNGTMLIDHTYKESLLMMLVHRIGLRAYLNGDATRWPLLFHLNQNLNLKTIILAILITLPAILVRPLYLLYLSFNYARSKGNLSIGQIISRYKLLHNFIRKNNNG